MKRLAVIFLLLQVADLGSTLLLFWACGHDPSIEGNPVGRSVLSSSGPLGLCVFKTVGVLAVAGIWLYLPDAVRRRLLDFGIGTMLAVVIGNMVNLARLVP